MSDAPDLDLAETICTFAGVTVGGAVGGTEGALIGGMAGRFVIPALKFARGVSYNVSINLIANHLPQWAGAIRERLQKLSSAERKALGIALQSALRNAVVAAFEDIGGPQCFPNASKRAVPNELIFRNTPSGARYWHNHSGEGAQLDDFLRAVAHRATDPATRFNPLEPTDLLRASAPPALAHKFYEVVVAPVEAGRGNLVATSGLAAHLRAHLFNHAVAHLGELLNRDTGAWRTFTRLLLVEISEGTTFMQQSLALGQVEIIQYLQKLKEVVDAQLDAQTLLATQLTELFAVMSALQAEQSHNFDQLYAILVEIRRSLPPPGIVIAPLHIGVPSRGRELVGRESLQDKVIAQLTKGESLALYGREGIGKTALAIAVANDARILAHFRDGVLWGGLGPTPNVAEVLDQWGRALGIDVTQLVTLADRAQAVKNAIGTRRFLLVINDSWGLDEASERLLRLDAPHSVHLMTTRVLRWARTFAGHKHTQEVKPLNSRAAHKLLREMAREAWAYDAATMRGLAAAVDFIPLALELIGNFLAQSDYTNFPELTQGGLAHLADPRTRLELAQERLGEPGHKPTWAEVIELSLTGLPDEAIHAFYALGAFAPQPARFDKAAALAVTGASLRDLSRLIDRGLLEKDKDEWLSLHQTIAEVAKRKVAPDAPARHRDHYLQLVEEVPDDYQRNETAYPQIQHAWAALADDDAHIYAFLGALDTYQDRRGLWREQEVWLKRGLFLVRALPDRYLEGVTFGKLGNVYQSQGRWREGIAQYEQSMAIFRELKDRRGEAWVNGSIGNIYQLEGSWAEAIKRFETSLELFRTLGDLQGVGSTLNNLGVLYEGQGLLSAAITCYEQDLAICRKLGDEYGEGKTLSNIGNILTKQEKWDAAHVCYEQAMEIYRKVGDRHSEGLTLNNLGTFHSKQRQWSLAIKCYETAREILAGLDDQHGKGQILMNLGSLYLALTQWSLAHDCFDGALKIFQSLGDQHSTGQTYVNLGILYDAQGDEERAQFYNTTALTKLHPDSPEFRNLQRRLGLDDAAAQAPDT